MRCERCQGKGFIILVKGVQGLGSTSDFYIPCPDCAGSGISYCCDEAGANPPNTDKDK